MLAGADVVGQPAEQRRRRVRVQLERLGGVDPPAGAHLVGDRLHVISQSICGFRLQAEVVAGVSFRLKPDAREPYTSRR